MEALRPQRQPFFFTVWAKCGISLDNFLRCSCDSSRFHRNEGFLKHFRRLLPPFRETCGSRCRNNLRSGSRGGPPPSAPDAGCCAQGVQRLAY